MKDVLKDRVCYRAQEGAKKRGGRVQKIVLGRIKYQWDPIVLLITPDLKEKAHRISQTQEGNQSTSPSITTKPYRFAGSN